MKARLGGAPQVRPRGLTRRSRAPWRGPSPPPPPRRFARAANCPGCFRKPSGGPAGKNSTRGARMSRKSSWRAARESSE
eukprot:590712-Pyramimonas_sp.AAC.1